MGGVETLFKESSAQVIQYANDAYKTAGMSANDYMETVTGFSASLLQSLGGDTAAAAQVANQAVTDMSDNANKMGTSIESIQNAYQGFAKGNFTMLDNLKLGYGGTKEEMERLLADAEAIQAQQGVMVDYSITSFADITEAIHVVQTEIGITGTTALEASTTIQGSLDSMKGAWTNLMAGIGDESANTEQLVSNFVDSVSTAAENMVPRITQILEGIGEMARQLGPKIAEALPGLVSEVLPALLGAATSMIDSLIDGLSAALPALAAAVPQIIETICNVLTENLP